MMVLANSAPEERLERERPRKVWTETEREQEAETGREWGGGGGGGGTWLPWLHPVKQEVYKMRE